MSTTLDYVKSMQGQFKAGAGGGGSQPQFSATPSFRGDMWISPSKKLKLSHKTHLTLKFVQYFNILL